MVSVDGHRRAKGSKEGVPLAQGTILSEVSPSPIPLVPAFMSWNAVGLEP